MKTHGAWVSQKLLRGTAVHEAGEEPHSAVATLPQKGTPVLVPGVKDSSQPETALSLSVRQRPRPRQAPEGELGLGRHGFLKSCFWPPQATY